MDKKYVGSTVVLPIDTAKALEEVQQALALVHGVEFSKSQVIAYLCHYHRTREKAAGTAWARLDVLTEAPPVQTAERPIPPG